jgi:predicted transcriptional regulator
LASKREIYESWKGGKKELHIARELGISKQRVSQVIKECRMCESVKNLLEKILNSGIKLSEDDLKDFDFLYNIIKKEGFEIEF